MEKRLYHAWKTPRGTRRSRNTKILGKDAIGGVEEVQGDAGERAKKVKVGSEGVISSSVIPKLQNGRSALSKPGFGEDVPGRQPAGIKFAIGETGQRLGSGDGTRQERDLKLSELPKVLGILKRKRL